jgi:hypothetical protein
MIRDWWKDEENRQHVQWLKDQIYGDSRQMGHRGLKTVGLPDLLLQEKAGQLLRRFLGELGVTVVPVAEAAVDAASDAAARARETIDCLITPMVKRAEQGREDVYARLQALGETLHTRWERLPRISFPLVADQGIVFEPFARIGLLFTSNLDRIRKAYMVAGQAEGLWETA